METGEEPIWLAAGVRTPFVGVDGPFAHRDSLALSVPVVQAMAPLSRGPIDFAVWGAVAVNLAYAFRRSRTDSDLGDYYSNLISISVSYSR